MARNIAPTPHMLIKFDKVDSHLGNLKEALKQHQKLLKSSLAT